MPRTLPWAIPSVTIRPECWRFLVALGRQTDVRPVPGHPVRGWAARCCAALDVSWEVSASGFGRVVTRAARSGALHLHRAHHAVILVGQDVAVVDELASEIG